MGKIHKHFLSSGLVDSLIKAVSFVHEHNLNDFHLQRDLGLNVSENNNFQKLRYWGFVAHVEGKRGSYLITRAGGMFLRGEVDTPVWVQTQDNHRIAKSEQRVFISHLRGKIPEFQSEWADEKPKVEGGHKQPALIAWH